MIVAKRKTSNIYHRMNCRYVENFCEDMAIDYRNLPKQTKRQKKYYNQTKRRERKKSTRRVLELFEKIEHEPYMRLVQKGGSYDDFLYFVISICGSF